MKPGRIHLGGISVWATSHEELVCEINRYPSEEVENLRAAVAVPHGVQPENITLGCGSTEIMRMAAEACLGPGKTLEAVA